MTAYYNENDPFAAAWLRELISKNLIAPGEVDERSIEDVSGDDVRKFTQCHFFAGIGGWSYALRLAGWGDERRVWTGSCPCQSFSQAGKQLGFADKRHLWPHWFRFIRECNPPVVFGEQVESAIRHGWLDLVSGDLEGEGYAIGAAILGAHSVGAPHIRQRCYFVADAERGRRDEGQRSVSVADANGEIRVGADASAARPLSGAQRGIHLGEEGSGSRDGEPERSRDAGLCADTTQRGFAMRRSPSGDSGHPALAGEAGVDLDAVGKGLEGHFGDVREWRGPGWLDPQQARSIAETGATRGFWGDCDWWYGRDDKYRPIGPGLQPLAHGVSGRVGKLRGYGNAIVPQVASEFIKAFEECK